MDEHASSINSYKLPECCVRLTHLPVITSKHTTEIKESNSVNLKNQFCEKPLPGEILKDVVKNKMCDCGLTYNQTLTHNMIQERHSKYVKPCMCPTCKCSFIEDEQFLNHGPVCQKNYVPLDTSVDIANLSTSDVEISKDPVETSDYLNGSSSDVSKYLKKCFVNLTRLSVNLKPTDVVKLCPFSEGHTKIDKHTEHFNETATYEHEIKINKQIHASSLSDKSKQVNMNNKIEQRILVKEEPVDVYEISDFSAENKADACVKQEIAEVPVDYIKSEIENLFNIGYSDNKIPNQKPSDSNDNVSLDTDTITTTTPVKNSYKCYKCKKGYTNRVDLKRHLVTHRGEKLFKCHLCEKRYPCKVSLLYHLKTHTGVKPFKCSECGKAFFQQSLLKYHLWRKHNKNIDNSENQSETYFCKICTKRCFTPLHLKRHMQSHEKLYKCHLCERSFSIKDNLKRHLVTHTSERSFKCNKCNYASTRSGDLKRHYLCKHSSHERPLKCHLCESSFYIKRNLNRHLLIHTGEMLFECNKCDYVSKRSDTLKRHCLRKHCSISPVITDQEVVVVDVQSKEEIPYQTINTLHTIKDTETVMAIKNDAKIQPTYNLDWKQSAGVSKTVNNYATASHALTNAEIVTDTKNIVNLKGCDDVYEEIKNTVVQQKQMGVEEHEFQDTYGNFCKIETIDEKPEQDVYKSGNSIIDLHELEMTIRTDEEVNDLHKMNVSLGSDTIITATPAKNSYRCEKCKKGFAMHNQLKKHMIYHAEKKYKCHLCEWSFSTRAYLKRHLLTHTGEKPFKCHLCEKKYTAKSSLLYHLMSHIGDKPFKCSECNKAFIQQSRLKYHQWHKHTKNTDNSENQNETFYFCKVCTKRCVTSVHLKKHMQSHEKRYKCHLCESSFAFKQNLNRHLVTHAYTREMSFNCHVCTKRYKTKESLSYHMMSHTENKPYKCGECDKAFIKQSQLKYHFWNVHNRSIDNSENQDKSSYYCRVCTKRCFSPVHLKKHMQSHEKKYKCHLCEGSFSVRGNLKRHLLSHTGEKPFTCHLCEKKYTTKSSLLYHLKSHIGDKPFKCSECNKAFIKQPQLENHMWNVHKQNIDNSENPNEFYHCNICPKLYKTASLLKCHMQCHEKPHKCHLCESSFSTKSSLKRHLVTHTGEKSFKCHLCAKRYTTRDSLLYHMKSHTGQRPFKCTNCDYTAKRNHDLKEHYLLKHHSNSLMNTGQATMVVDVQSKEETLGQTTNNLHTFQNINTPTTTTNNEETQLTYNSECKQLAGVNKTANGYSTMAKNSYECEKCKKGFAIASLLKRHLKTHSDETPYECNFCHNRYKHKHNLNDHIKSHNLENQSHEKPHKCHLCKSSFSRKDSLNRHLLIHTGESPFKCNQCDYVGTRSNDVRRHCLRKHGCNSSVNTDHAMVVVDVQSKDEIPYQPINTLHTIKNIETEKIQPLYSLDYQQSVGMSKTTNVDYAANLHALTVAETITDSKCTVNLNYKERDDVHGCYEEITNKAGVEEHEFGDTYGNFCNIENNAEGSKQMGKEEIEFGDTNFWKTEEGTTDITEEKIIVQGDDEVNESHKIISDYIVKAELTNNIMNISLDTDLITPAKISEQHHEKKYKCHLCEWSCSRRAYLKQHLGTHTGEKSFKCKLCDKEYLFRGSFLYHLKTHTGEKPFKCNECGKAFIKQSLLKRHLGNIHNKSIDNSENEYEFYYCNICSKRCISPSHLKQHMHCHEKPHKCHLCESSFSIKPNLKRHLVTHTGEKLFKCHLCESSYTTKESLLYHMKSHTREKPFKCNKCDYAAKLSKELNKHCLRKHRSNSLVNIDPAMVVVDEHSEDSFLSNK